MFGPMSLYPPILISLMCIALLLLMHKIVVINDKKKKSRDFIRRLLEAAQLQNAIFSINIEDKSVRYHTISCIFIDADGDSIKFEAIANISEDYHNEPIVVYYKFSAKDGVISYKFCSKIRNTLHFERSTILQVEFPEDIAPGERRLFHRIKPPKDRVRLIALWEQPRDKPLPKSTKEIGRPLVQYRYAEDSDAGEGADDVILVSDISASGIAVSLSMAALGERPIYFNENELVLCLLAYCKTADSPLIIYWSSCRICNVRDVGKPLPRLILGMEFKDWALLQQGKSEIAWFHAKQEAGVSPMSQWVRQIELDQHAAQQSAG